MVPRAMLGINKSNIPALEAWTLELLDWLDWLDWLDDHFSRHNYLLGGRPCYGDFSLYGPLHAHLASDTYPLKHLIQPRQKLHAWLERMGATPQHIGEWLSGDDIPETLVQILQSQFQDQLHHNHAAIDKTAHWISPRGADNLADNDSPA